MNIFRWKKYFHWYEDHYYLVDNRHLSVGSEISAIGFPSLKDAMRYVTNNLSKNQKEDYMILKKVKTWK